MRDQTEWVELIEHGVNILAGAETKKIIDLVNIMLGKQIDDLTQLYGGGQASKRIVQYLANR